MNAKDPANAPHGHEAAVSIRRVVNDEILQVATPLDDGAAVFEFLCECGDLSCRGLVAMTLADYRATSPGSIVSHD